MAQEHLTAETLYLFNEGTLSGMYEHFGAQVIDRARQLTRFAVWAPNAERVSVIGDFNGSDPQPHPMQPQGDSGVYLTTVPGMGKGSLYKYHIQSPRHGFSGDKADPVSFAVEIPPKTSSVVWDWDYEWHDQPWMANRRGKHWVREPVSIYEMHIGSWKKHEDQTSLSYRQLRDELVDYVANSGFTHVEFLPVMEHPYYGSWGYQVTSYFAPSSRFGTPEELMALIDAFHQRGIGVILDWVPSHFATDAFGLGFFDGTHLYEHANPQQGVHPQWQSYIFNYDRNEVRSFLASSAMYWLDKFHADGLRVDAVSSMLYLDFAREPGQWTPNPYGGRENLAAIRFLRQLNQLIHARYPDVLMIAEESTAWPKVSFPAEEGGLGFDFKWDMGWMHDTLSYMSRDPVHRRYHHDSLTFRPMYALSEHFVLPLSHDEVVHGKGSLINKMPGDTWQKFANLRLLLAYMFASPGKKLLFMGSEFGQWQEWSHDRGLDWFLLEQAFHAGAARLVADLNAAYRASSALWEQDDRAEGFQWSDFEDRAGSVIAFLRWDTGGHRPVLSVFNFTPVVRPNYLIGVPKEGVWQERINTDSAWYGGSNQGNCGHVMTESQAWRGHPYRLRLTLPPLAATFFEFAANGEPARLIPESGLEQP